MAKQLVNIGTSINKGDGDPLRTAFDKINQNFNELYASTTLDLDSIGSNMIPTTVGGFALGSATKQWSDLYVRDFIYIGGTRLQSDAQGNITVDGGSLQIKDVQGDIFADDSTKVFDSATQTFTGKFEGELIGTVAADDSTVLIDGVAGTINAGALTGALPAIDGSALTGITSTSLGGQAASYYLDFANFTNTPTTIAGYGITDAFNGAFGSLTGTPTTLSGYGITDAYTQTQVDTAITNATSSIVIPSGSSQSIDVVASDSTLLVDSANGTLNATTLTGALPAINGSALTNVTTTFANITSKPTTLAGYGITDAANTSAETTFTADVKFDTGVEEKFATLTGSTGVVAHDCDNGHVFYHTGASGDITANFTNLGLTAEYATNLTVIINQGATPYEVTAVQIGGAAQTINWQGGSAPTGNANGIDSFSFTILNDGGSYVVLGQMVDFT